MSTEALPVTFKSSNFWAIPVSNTKHREWLDFENSNSRLSFNWQEVKANGLESKNKIIIAVGQAYSKADWQEVNEIANGIYLFNKIKEGDTILAITGSTKVQKVGHVESNSKTDKNKSLDIKIKWIDEIKPGESNLPIFNTAAEIQNVTPNMLRQLDLPLAFEDKQYEYIRESIHGEYELQPELQLHYLDLEPKEDKGGKISLFFGTNRSRTAASSKPNDFFGSELADLEYGTCEVDIPAGHVQGEIERPFKKWLLSFKEAEGEHFILNSINPSQESSFIAELIKALSDSSEKAGFVFIHGFNTSFAEAAWRTAQIAWDVPFNGPACFFSWPSSARKISYDADIEKADASIAALSNFIKAIITKTNISKLHLIAHSMGNRILTRSLIELSNDQTIKTQLSIINQIILGAPDIDKDVFNNTILPVFKGIGAGRTLYASDKDKALNMSAILRGGRTRIGDTRESIYVNTGIDTIDASNVPSRGNNHSYIFETKELLSDLYYIMSKGLPPDQRRLRPIVTNNLKYWLFPK